VIDEEGDELSESPYTLPNALTVARIIACPFLGYQIVHGDYVSATALLFACGVSDWVSCMTLSSRVSS
jgi:cardiolipin synthase